MAEKYDVVILGGGPAGLTAAIYASRYNLSTLVVAKSFGGTTNLAGEIENWPGFMGSGMELMNKVREQAKNFGAEFLESEIKEVKKTEEGFELNLDDKKVCGKTLIVALGTEHRKLNISGEQEFLGKGVSYCATCDGMFFKDKNVAVIGGADSAAKAALYLSGIAKNVYVVYRKTELRCEPIVLDKIRDVENITIYGNALPVEIKGEDKVEKMEVEQTPELEGDVKKFDLDVDGVFIEIGATPATEVVKDLGLEIEKGSIVTDKNACTSVEGVYAAGDVTNNKLKQVVTAAGEGAIAARSAYDFLLSLRKS